MGGREGVAPPLGSPPSGLHKPLAEQIVNSLGLHGGRCVLQDPARPRCPTAGLDSRARPRPSRPLMHFPFPAPRVETVFPGPDLHGPLQATLVGARQPAPGGENKPQLGGSRASPSGRGGTRSLLMGSAEACALGPRPGPEFGRPGLTR